MISLTGLDLSEWDPASKILHGIVAIFESAFPGRIASYYVVGSYGTGDRIPTSDLDLYIVFRKSLGTHAAAARRIADACAAMSSILLEIRLLSETGLQSFERVGTVLTLRHSSTLIFGNDLQSRLPAVSPARYSAWTMHVPFGSMAQARPQLNVLTVPLDYPDPAGTFYGFDQIHLPSGAGPDQPSTKMLVVTVGWIATALLVQRTGQYVATKRAAVTQYRAIINDEWSDLVEQVHAVCRNQWAYRVPDTRAEQTHLRTLCRQALGFENHFLEVYRQYLLRALQDTDSENQFLAVRRLGQVLFRDQDVLDAVTALTRVADERLRQAGLETLATIRAHQA